MKWISISCKIVSYLCRFSKTIIFASVNFINHTNNEEHLSFFGNAVGNS